MMVKRMGIADVARAIGDERERSPAHRLFHHVQKRMLGHEKKPMQPGDIVILD